MQASTAAFATTIAGNAMTVTHTVTIDFGVAGNALLRSPLFVESLTVDRQLTTDMPDGTRLISGYPAASATLTLTGLIDRTDATKTVAWLLNPAENDSPLYRTDILNHTVTIQAGLYLPGSTVPEQVTVFTGVVDDYTVDMQAGTVQVSCLDNRAALGIAPTLPSFAGDVSGDWAQKPGLYASYALDQLARTGGFYSSPPPRTNCVYYASCHGSLWPEIGTVPIADPLTGYGSNIVSLIDNSIDVTGVYSQGVWSPQVMGSYDPTTFASVANVAKAVQPIPLSAGSAFYAEGYAHRTAGIGTLFLMQAGGAQLVLGTTYEAVIILEILDDTPTTQTVTLDWKPDLTGLHDQNMYTGTPARSDGWHHYAFQWAFNSATSITYTIWVDGTVLSTATVTLTTGTTAAGSQTMYKIGAAAYGAMENVQFALGAQTPASTLAFTPTAYLDPSLNPLITIPDTTGQDSWALVQQIAQAEGGVAGFDELGVFRFFNRDTINSRSPARTVAATSSLKQIQQQLGMSLVRTHIRVPVNSLQVQPYSWVWGAPQPVTVPPGGVYSTVVTLPSSTVAVGQTCVVIPAGAPPTAGISGYRAAKKADGTGGQISNLAMTVTPLTPTTVAVQVSNPNSYPAYLVSPTGSGYPPTSDGQPSFAVGGQPVTAATVPLDSTNATAGGASYAESQWPNSIYGDRLLTTGSNMWVQNLVAAQGFSDDLMVDMYRPRPMWRNMRIVADPRIQLTDRLTVSDPYTSGITDDGLVVGVHLQVDANAFEQTVDLRAVATPGGWIMGQPGRSEMGVSTYV